MANNFMSYNDATLVFTAVGERKQDVMQVTSFPTTDVIGGTIVQYLGPTTEDYTNGYFYQYNITDNIWENIPVQAGGEAIEYVNSLPASSIENKVYATKSYTGATAEVGVDFLDEDENFTKVGDTYVAASGVFIEASVDSGATYAAFESIEYVSPSWTLTVDGDTATLAAGDTFYYRVINYKFYAGNEQEQKTIPLASGDGSSSYTAGYGIDLTNNEISASDFVGLRAEWEVLSATQQAAYDGVYIIDDVSATAENPGHLVVSEEDTEMVQRNKLQFTGGVEVTDVSADDVTKVEVKEYTAGRAIEINDYEIAVDDSISPTFVGTRAEWEALTSEEKAAYTIVNIVDDIASGDLVVVDAVEDENYNPVTSNAVFDLKRNTVYSTEETFTGKYWINNKKIYRKVFTGTLTVAANSTTNLFSVASLNIELPIRIDGILHINGSYQTMQNNVSRMWLEPSGYLTFEANAARTDVPYWITLEYTKTLD